MNRQDFFNECVVSASTYWKILYTSIVEKKEDQFYFAKMELAFILLYCFVNLVLIVLMTVYNSKKFFVGNKYSSLFPDQNFDAFFEKHKVPEEERQDYQVSNVFFFFFINALGKILMSPLIG